MRLRLLARLATGRGERLLSAFLAFAFSVSFAFVAGLTFVDGVERANDVAEKISDAMMTTAARIVEPFNIYLTLIPGNV